MARPHKQGLEWFKHYSDYGNTDAAGVIITECGVKGYGILMLLLEKIYTQDGYYTRWDSRVATLFAGRTCQVGVGVVQEVVSSCLREGIFDSDMFRRYSILTSEEIQENFFDGVKKRTGISIDERYLLIPVPNSVFGAETDVSDAETNENSAESTQSKSKSKSKSKSTDTINYIYPVADDDDCAADAPPYNVIESYCLGCGLSAIRAEDFYNTMVRNDWRDQDGRPIRDWRSVAQKWAAMSAPPFIARMEKEAY